MTQVIHVIDQQKISVDDGTAALLVTQTSSPLPTGAATEATLLKIAGLSIPIYDFISLALTDSVTETYTFKTGGSGGSTVATVTVVYTDSTKANLLTVTKV